MRQTIKNMFNGLLKIAIQYFKNNPNLKSKVISLLQKLGLHTLGLRIYARILKLDNSMVYTWLLPQGINILDFRERLNAALEDSERLKTQTPIPEDAVVLGEQLGNEFPLAAVICSLYKVEQYLDAFLSNIRSQDCFHAVEFCFILCAGSQFELETLQRFTDNHSNCILIAKPERIGIYSAWNLGVRATSAPIITNWNADDSRRPDSLGRQIEILSTHRFVDVVYQDLYVTLEPKLPWKILEKAGIKTKLPSVSIGGLLQGLNAPHNAPMWRRSLHDEIGYFDEKYRSAGDYEFWLRAAMENKIFLKDRDPHVSYFVNPQGLSTSRKSLASSEMLNIQELYREAANQVSRKQFNNLNISNHASQPDEVTKNIISRISSIRLQNE